MKADITLDIFQFKDYRYFVNSWIKSQDKKGHGQLRKIGLYLRIAPVTITQIFRGDRELPIEAAPRLAEYLHLTGIHRKYFALATVKKQTILHLAYKYIRKNMEESCINVRRLYVLLVTSCYTFI